MNGYTSPLLMTLSDTERELLSVIADPLIRGVYGWPTWNYVDLTFRRRCGQEASTVAAGLPWVMLEKSLGPYRLFWASDNVSAGAAPTDDRTIVGLTVAGMCHITSDFGGQDDPIALLGGLYPVILGTLRQSLLTAAPKPGGVVRVGVSRGWFADTLRQGLMWPPEVDALAHITELAQREPATWLQALGNDASDDNTRISARLPLDELASSEDPRDYVEILTTRFAAPLVFNDLPRQPRDLVDAFERLNLALRPITGARLWRQVSMEYPARLVGDPHSAAEYRDNLAALCTIMEAMEVRGDPEKKSLRRLEALISEKLSSERTAELAVAIDDLLAVVDLRVGIQHSGDKPARRAAEAARRLGIPPSPVDFVFVFDRIARRVIAALRILTDLIAEIDLAESG